MCNFSHLCNCFTVWWEVFCMCFFYIYIFVRLLDNLLKIQYDSRLRATSNNWVFSLKSGVQNKNVHFPYVCFSKINSISRFAWPKQFATHVYILRHNSVFPPVDGKTRRTEEAVKCKLEETETKASGNLQFYKEKVQNCHSPLKKEVAGSHESKNNKKRALAEQERERTSKQKHLCLTVEDWDLLNTYWVRKKRVFCLLFSCWQRILEAFRGSNKADQYC